MKAMRFLSFVAFATAMFAFFACSGNDEPNNEPSSSSNNEPSSSSSNEPSSGSNDKYACYIDVSDLEIGFTDEKYGPGHYYCYDYSEPSARKYMQGCLLMTGGVALEECPKGYAKKCEELSYNGDVYEFIGYIYRYGEKFVDYECK